MKGKRIMILARTGMILPLLAMFFSSCKEKGILDWSDPEAALKKARVGVLVGWTQDYLYENAGLPCVRYQDLPEGIMALGNGDIDAFYTDYILALEAVEQTDRFKILDYGMLPDDVGLLCRTADTEFRAQWDEFIPKLREHPVWKEVQEGSLYTMTDPEDIPPVAAPKEGKLLRVGYEDENYPLTYYLPTGEVVGYGVTILNLFAQEYGYRLEYRSGTWDSNVLSLQHKKIDCIMDYFSSSFTEMMESTGEFKRTPSVLEYYMVYLVRNAEAVE